MPYRIGDILRLSHLPFDSFESKGMIGLKTDGIYGYLRHPIESGMLCMMLFMNGVYTTDKVLHIAVMASGIIIGVLMAERRFMTINKD
jgi:protein-S-isoprenylcysteine O-methyltransferase Ste14